MKLWINVSITYQLEVEALPNALQLRLTGTKIPWDAKHAQKTYYGIQLIKFALKNFQCSKLNADSMNNGALKIKPVENARGIKNI